MADSDTPRTQAHHVTDSLIEVDLVADLEALRASDSYQMADHAARTIAKHPGIRVVLIALQPGGQMHEHHADSAITVQGSKVESNSQWANGRLSWYRGCC
jgi:quercetin dioxygenase-like cupin family protein